MAEERDFEKTYQKNTSRRRSSRLRRSRRRWRVFLAIYSVLFLALGAVGCYYLYQYADAYEKSRPELVMDELMANSLPEDWFRQARKDADAGVTEFEDGAALMDEYIRTTLQGKEITYRKAAGEYSDAAPVYQIRCGGKTLCTVTLAPVGHHAAGFGRELWTLGEIRSGFTMDGLESVAVEIDAPAGETVYLNGIAVGNTWLTGENVPCPNLTELESRFAVQPSFVRYRVEPLYGAITVTDSRGQVLTVAETGEQGVVRCTAAPDTLYSVTVLAPESVEITIGGAKLTAADARSADYGILTGLEAYTAGAAAPRLTYSFDGLYTLPEVTGTFQGRELTPLMNEKGELLFFQPQDEALKAAREGVVQNFFDRYIRYSSQAYEAGRYNALLSLILPGTDLYTYVRDSVDAMIWASATQVHYDELTFTDFVPAGDNCFTCTIRYKADFAATAWYESYTYDLQNAYELAFVRVGEAWYAAAMSAIAG